MTKVLFIMGVGRSGSTILDNLLGELDGFFSMGELDGIWFEGLLHEGRCGCHVPLEKCEVWSAVLSAVFDATQGPRDVERIVRWQEETARVRNTWRLLRQEIGRESGWEALDAYVRVLARLFAALARVTGARVLVDSSKGPAQGAILRLVEGVKPYIVHLVRDPRAVAFSRQRVKVGRHGHPMRRLSAFYVASRWVARNAASHMVRRRYGADRSLLVRYEDFVARPASTLQTIADFVGERPSRLPFLDERTARLGINHTVFGNPSRFETGTVKLHSDEEWKTGQRRLDRLVATAVSLPLLPRYGYPVLVGTSALDA